LPRKKEEVLLDAQKITRATTRIAHEILEKNSGAENLVIIGILRRGMIFTPGSISQLSSVQKYCSML